MNLTRQQIDALHVQASAVIDGTITPVDFADFCALLRESESARLFYAEYVYLQVSLLRALKSQPESVAPIAVSIAPAKPITLPLAGLLTRVSRRVPGGEFAVGTLVILVVAAAFWGLSQAILYPRHGANGGSIVATISGTADAKWSSRNSSAAESLQVNRSEPLQIDTGLVELKLLQGTTLLIEGPAAWSIDGENQATLLSGKLVAKVPSQAVGFTLNTPIGKIVDLGTEFGAEVSPDGESEIHVYSGKVNAFVAQTSADQAPRKTELRTGQSIRVRSVDGRIQSQQQATDPNRFVRTLKAPIEQTTAKGMAGRSRLLLDPALLVRYTFDKPDDESTILTNHSAATRGKYDGVIHGCNWTTGSKNQRSALQFGETEDRVELHIDGKFNALTIGASIYFEPHVDQPAYTPILMGDRWGTAGQFHLQLHKDARPNVSICGEHDKIHVITCQNSLGKGDFGRWVKMVIILDTQSREVVYFLDGAFQGSVAMPLSEPLSLANTHIGHWLPWKDELARQLTGRMDELLIFSRALRPEETRVLFNEERSQDE